MRIEKIFYIDDKKKLGDITLGIAVDMWSKFSNENYKRLMKYKASIGVCWEYHNKEGDLSEVDIFEEGKSLFAYPSPDMKYMVVKFSMDSEYCPHPNNLVVFYPNGKIKHIIGLPELISDYAITNRQNPMGEVKEGYFSGIGWSKRDEKIIMKVDIHFAWENTETREFDPETGEFGELIGVSGRC